MQFRVQKIKKIAITGHLENSAATVLLIMGSVSFVHALNAMGVVLPCSSEPTE